MPLVFFLTLLVIVCLGLTCVAVALKNPKVQRWAYQKWAEPVLLEYGVKTNFSSFRYENKHFIIDELTVSIEDAAISQLRGISLGGIHWNNNELNIDSFQADSIYINAKDTAFLKNWYLALPKRQESSSTGLRFDNLGINEVVVALDSSRQFVLDFKAIELQVAPEIGGTHLAMNITYDTLSSAIVLSDFALDTIQGVKFDVQTNFGANVHGRFKTYEGTIAVEFSGNTFPSIRQWGLDSTTTKLVSDARFEGHVTGLWPDLNASYTVANDFFNVKGSLNSSTSSYSTTGVLVLKQELYTSLDGVNGFVEFDELHPDVLRYEFLVKEDLSDVGFDITASSNDNNLRVHSPSMNDVAKIEIDLPNYAVGPILGGSVKAALKPSIQSVLDGENFEIVGLAPHLNFQTHQARGFSFALNHSGHDSLWWSCLDTLMDLEGHVNAMDGIYKGKATINALGLVLLDPLDTGQIASGELEFNVTDSFEGFARIKNALLTRPNDVVFFNEANISHHRFGSKRSVEVNSEVLSGSLEGSYEFAELFPIAQTVFSDLIGQKPKRNFTETSFNLNADIGNVNWLTQLFHLDISLPEGGSIRAVYEGVDNSWSVLSDLPVMTIGTQRIDQLKMNTSATNNLISGSLSIESGQFPGIDLAESSVVWKPSNKQGATIHIARQDSILGSLDATVVYDNKTYEVVDGMILLDKDSIQVVNGGPIYWDGATVHFDTIKMAGTQGSINIGGVIGGKPNESLWLTWQNGNAHIFNYFYRDPNLVLSGPLALQLEIPSLQEGFDLRAFMQSPKFMVNGWNYGSLNLNTRWDGYRSDLFLNGYLKQGKADARINGHYDAIKDDLDLTLSTNEFVIAPFQSYIQDVLSPINGRLSGGVQLFGPLANWQLKGEFSLDNASFGVPIIGGALVASSPLDFSLNEQSIRIDTSYWQDEKYGTEALLWGTIAHDRFQTLAFDLKMSTDSLYAMQLERQYDSYFFGKGIAGGTMELDGPIEQLHLGLNLETKEGTAVRIPLDNPMAVETPSFIQFVQNNTSTSELDRSKKHEYFTTDIDVQVTPEAQVELILDEVLGDIIKARGNGAMQMKILEDESFELYGLYTVESGDYLFTLQGIINKQFELLPGGTILWSGDLYEAELNLKAKYSLSTSLNGLITNPNYNNSNVDVDLIVELTGPLLSPEIGFTIELPNSPPSYQQELERRILTADAMNYQAFSLLMLGDFYRQNLAVQEGINLGESLSRSTSEMLVSQFGGWITAGLGSYVDVELDYTSGNNPYNSLISSGDEIRLGVSKNFLDGRLRINSSVDVPLAQDGSSTLLLGDTQIEYALTKDGRTVLKAFNRSNRNDPLLQSSGPYTQGVGIQFRKDFENLKKD